MKRNENARFEYGDDCHICGAAVADDLVTCEECLDVIPDKRYVLECEWCEQRWYSDFKCVNVARSMLHVHRNHQEELRRDYS